MRRRNRFRNANLSLRITRRFRYPKPHRSFYLIFNMFTNSFSCQSIPERTTGGSYFYLLSYKIPCGICPSWYFFLSYCSIIYFSINNIFLILLTSYPSVLPSRTLLSFLRYFHCYRSGNHSTPSETPPVHKTFIQKCNHPSVLISPDDSSCRL